jgi:hypothetical protein
LEFRRYRNVDPAQTGGSGDPLTPDEAEAWSAGDCPSFS